jgi:hypothetical protein
MEARAQLAELMAEIKSASMPPALPSWEAGLDALFEREIEPFVYRLALETADLGRCETATRLADAILLVSPAHLQATGIVVTCAESRGDLTRARDAIARLLAASDPDGFSLPDIRLEYASLLAQTGERDEARRQLARLLAAPGDTPRRAREMIERLEPESRP